KQNIGHNVSLFRSASDSRVPQPAQGMQEEFIQSTSLRRVWRAIGFGLVILVVWLSLTPHPIAIPIEHGDKLGHFGAYATLMFWFAQLDGRHRKRVAYAIGFVTLGVALEFAQRLTNYRAFEV